MSGSLLSISLQTSCKLTPFSVIGEKCTGEAFVMSGQTSPNQNCRPLKSRHKLSSKRKKNLEIKTLVYYILKECNLSSHITSVRFAFTSTPSNCGIAFHFNSPWGQTLIKLTHGFENFETNLSQQEATSQSKTSQLSPILPVWNREGNTLAGN